MHCLHITSTHTTVTLVSLGSVPWIVLKKVEALTTSKVVTPNNLLGSKTPCFFKTSAKMGTVELTGLEMMRTMAEGACSAVALARSRTIEALVFYRHELE